jgi:lambda repressor-like predicted transcriptional regulator
VIDDRRHAQIKGALGLKGLSLSDIARSLAVTPSSVSIVSRGFRRSRRIEQAIADALGETPEAVWPGRYRERPQTKDAAMPEP